MHKTVLVAEDIKGGRRVVDFLKSRDIDVVAAFWRLFEYEYQLVIVSEKVASQGPRKIYTLLQEYFEALPNGGPTGKGVRLNDIRLEPPNALLYAEVQDRIGLRFADPSAEWVMVEDVYEYDVSTPPGTLAVG
jgi:hypothetical protein